MAIMCAAYSTMARQNGTEEHTNSGSELSIVAAKVQMLLIAPDGRRTGFEPKSQKIIKAIPNSAYYQDALLQYDSGRVDPNTTQTIDVKRPPIGRYRLLVTPGTAADGEEYDIRVNLYLQGGGETRTTRIAGTAEAGKIANYELRVNVEPPGVVVVEKLPGSPAHRR
jgi:hypothetical protein